MTKKNRYHIVFWLILIYCIFAAIFCNKVSSQSFLKLPKGTVFQLRLLESVKLQSGESFEATLVGAILIDGTIAINYGSTAWGTVQKKFIEREDLGKLDIFDDLNIVNITDPEGKIFNVKASIDRDNFPIEKYANNKILKQNLIIPFILEKDLNVKIYDHKEDAEEKTEDENNLAKN